MAIKAPKGTKDLYGSEMAVWQTVEEIIRQICRDFGVSEIRTPVFEHTELFTQGSGDTTDVVQKQMYTFMDKGKRSMTLKPEGTVGVARAYIENSMYAGVQPIKLYYIAPHFRYENPQAGRMRQFHQFGLEIFGSYSAAADAEVISLAYELISHLHIRNTTLYINSLGCPTCRQVYNRQLKAFIAEHVEELCPTCRERYENNPLRVLDCKVEGCKKVIENAPSILDALDDDCKKHFHMLQKILTQMEIPFQVNSQIVRGLDYYTRTVFEFICDDLGAQSTICGGGRYDNLVAATGGPETGAVGFGMGMERVILALQNQGQVNGNAPHRDIFVGSIGEEGFIMAQKLVHDLRQKGIAAESDILERSVKAQMKFADKIGAKYAMIIGEDEIKNNAAKIKNMQTGVQSDVELSQIEEFYFSKGE